jgi:hypothetical protein
MGDEDLVELYFRTTLELRDDEGRTWRISPVSGNERHSDPLDVLSPFIDAFILTAENPESTGDYSAEQNAAATAELRSILTDSPVTFRDCPGYAWDGDHVEPGFAILARDEQAAERQELALHLARQFQQNAIFHLSADGLAIMGALRSEMRGLRKVICERT